MQEINDFLGIAVVGGILSVAFELIKKWIPDSPEYKKLAVLGLSVVFGSIYWYLRGTPYYETVLGVLAASSTVYALLLKEDKYLVGG